MSANYMPMDLTVSQTRQALIQKKSTTRNNYKKTQIKWSGARGKIPKWRAVLKTVNSLT